MSEFNLLNLLLSLIITITVYSLPIIIVRYAILRRPINQKKAKITTVIYAFVGFIIMAIIAYLIDGNDAKVTGGGLLLWSYVNYRMLISGKDKRKELATCSQFSAVSSANANIDSSKSFSTPQKENTKKITYCKLCGSAIDSKTKRCTGCGKQFFHITKPVIILSILCFVIVVLSILNVFQYFENVELSTNASELQEEIVKKENSIKAYEKSITLLSKQRDEYMLKANFLDDHIVIVSNDGKYTYHKYGCASCDMSYFWAYNSEAAIGQGYKQCPFCCG